MFYKNICISGKACWQNPFLMLMPELWPSLDLYSTTLPNISLRWKLFTTIWLCLQISETSSKDVKKFNDKSVFPTPYKIEHCSLVINKFKLYNHQVKQTSTGTWTNRMTSVKHSLFIWMYYTIVSLKLTVYYPLKQSVM